MLSRYKRKGVYLTLFLLFFSSCTSSASHWVLEKNINNYAGSNSVRLRSITETDFRTLAVELIRNENSMIAYANIFCGELKGMEENPIKISFVLFIDEQPYPFLGNLLCGNQKFQLPSDAVNLLTEVLIDGYEVRIISQGYQGVLKPEDFLKKYTEFARCQLHRYYLPSVFIPESIYEPFLQLGFR